MSTPSDPMPEPGATPSGAVPPPPAGAVPPPPAGAVPPPAYTAPAGGYQTPPPGYAAPPPAYGAPMGAPMSDSDQRMWAMLSHLGGIIFGFIPSLVIYLMYREKSRFVEEQAKEALNFQIAFNIALIVSAILMAVLIGFILFPLVYIAGLIFMVMAGIAANKGQAYRYPANLRLIK